MSSRKKINRGRNKRKVPIPRSIVSRVVKYHDVTLSYASVNTTPGFLSLSDVPQGSAQSNRVADTVWPIKLEFRILWNAANSDVFSHVRYLLFRWLPNDAAYSPTSPSIFNDITTQGVISPLSFERRLEYRVLRDKLLTFTGTSSNPTVGSAITHQYTVPLTGRIDYMVGSSRGLNHIYFVNFSDSALTPFPAYFMQTRLWYYDA